jgi:hypothetical protein
MPHPRSALLMSSRRQIMLGAAGTMATVFGFEAALAAGQPALVAATFQPFIGEDFIVDNNGAPTGLRLLQVVIHGRDVRPSRLRNPFSLIFSSPWKKTLPAHTYAVRLPNHDTVAMFIMPISSNQYHYEAPFN